MDTPKSSNRFVFFLFLHLIATSFVLSFIFLEFLPEPSTSAMTIINQSIVFLIPCILMAIIHCKQLREIFPFRWIGFKNCLLIIGMCILIQPLMMLLGYLSSFLFDNNVSEVVTDIAMDGSFLLTMLTVAVTPAICEELAMRGVALSGYKKKGIYTAALFNGLFFGLMHFDLQQLLYTFVLGFIFTVFVRRTNSLISSMLGHFTINAVQSALAFASLYASENLELAEEAAEVTTADELIVLIGLLVVSLIITPFFCVLFYYFNKHNKALEITSETIEFANEYINENETMNETAIVKSKVISWELFASVLFYASIMSVLSYLNTL